MNTRGTILLLLVAASALASVLANDVYCTWQECNEECNSGKRRCDRSNGKVWNIDCHVQNCIPFEGCGSADVVFVFDSSASIGERNWWVTKQFAIDVTKGLNLAYDESRIAAVTYSKVAQTHWILTDFPNGDEIEDEIWALDWMADVTNTHEGLQHAEFLIDKSARADVKHIVVLLTDGVSNVNADMTIPQAERMHAKGIEIFVLGIGEIDEDEILGIGSEPKDVHCHFVLNYNALAQIADTVINETCAAANLSYCGPWSDWTTECEFEDSRQCGDGTYSRSRECTFYLWEGGDYFIRIHTETKPCSGPPCPPTEEPPEPECEWTECDAPCGRGKRYCDRGNGKVWTIPCHVQDCDPIEDCGLADVTFLLDSSASIGSRNYWRTKQFAIDVALGLPIDPDNVHVAAVSFSRDGEVDFELNDYYNPVDLEEKLWGIPWKRETTNTAEGLQLARDVTIDGGRAGVKGVVIVLTDGESNVNHAQTIPVAQTLHAAGLDVFAIVVRDTNSPEFDAIASEPTSIYRHDINDYDALTEITNIIIDQTCRAARGVLKP